MEDFVVDFDAENRKTSDVLLIVLWSIGRLEAQAINTGHDLRSPFLRAVHNAREKIYRAIDSNLDPDATLEAVAVLEEIGDLYIRLVDPARKN